MADSEFKPFDFPLNGRLITKLDPALLPEGHFQILQNMRYNDGGIEPISGMTKINAAAFNYTKARNGFHFKKSIPNAESHVMVQNVSGSNSRIVKSDNTTAIPAQDTFSAFITLPTNNYVNFSEAPDQSMVACDGYTNYVYSGDEYRVAKFINFDPGGSFSYDYTNIANNNLTDTNNVFSFGGTGGGIDTNTKAIWHFDGVFTDASGNSHTITNHNISFSFGRFNEAVKLTAASFSYLDIADHADFNFSGNVYAIDGVFNVTSLAAINPIYYQRTTGDADSFSVYIDTDGSIKVKVRKTGSGDFTATTPASVITAGVPSHIAIVQNNTALYIFVEGLIKFYGTAPTTIQNYTGNIQIGYNNTVYYDGWIDELRVSLSARWTDNFSAPLAAYSAAASIAHAYIGSTRPVSGFKFYVKTANGSAATATVYYWNGTAFTTVSNLVDNTSVSGKTLAKTGTITFDSTVALAKVKAINENVAYFYHVVFSGIDTGTEISQVSLITPVQGLTDIWDGVPRQIYSFLTQRAGIYTDYTSNVYALDYYPTDASTYVDIGQMKTTEYVYMGFQERLLGLKIYFGGTNVNTTSALIYLDYWNGQTWVTVGTIDDGTAVSGISYNRPGVATWNSPSEKLEYVTSVGNSAQWYYYRLHFSADLSAGVYIDNVTGIPAQVNIHPYRYPVLWQNRLWLLNDQSKDKNVAISSSYGTVCVFNGTDSARLTFGGTQEVVAAAPLFTRYGGSIYENLVVCKRNQTYLVDGTTPSNYIVYEIAKTLGCISPSTLIACDTGYEVAPGLTKHVLVWLSASGIVMFDSNSIIKVSGDIDDRFDPQSANYINTAITEQFTAFYDAKRFTYHIQIATGSSTTLNEEWAYDLTRRKWYQVNRGTKYLSCGFEVEDIIGNKYVYGGTDDGYLERLEYGNTFDGVNIVYKCRLPDGLLDSKVKSLMYQTEVRRIKLTGKANSTVTKVIIRHYAEGSTTASIPAIPVIDQNISGKRIYQVGRSVTLKAVFHSFEFEISTNDVSGGFYPLYVSGFYRVIRENLAV